MQEPALKSKPAASLPAAPTKLQQLEARLRAGQAADPLAGVVAPNIPKESSPHPDPLPEGGEREQDESRERGQAEPAAAPGPSLTDRVRALYENTIVPVREIARLLGVSERTIYKYVARYGWQRRHVCTARENLPPPTRVADDASGGHDDAAVRAASRGRALALRQVLPREGFAPDRGAGGRFIAREDRGTPQPRGLKALDPLGAQAAAEAAARAHLFSDIAVAEAELREAGQRAARDRERDVRMLGHLTRAMRDLTAVARVEDAREIKEREAERQLREAVAAQERRTDELRRDLARKLDAMMASSLESNRESDRECERDARDAAARARAGGEFNAGVGIAAATNPSPGPGPESLGADQPLPQQPVPGCAPARAGRKRETILPQRRPHTRGPRVRGFD
jgi:predicted DNA-binding transcriptional regulator AlpA